jgi:hypothetical protein
MPAIFEGDIILLRGSNDRYMISHIDWDNKKVKLVSAREKDREKVKPFLTNFVEILEIVSTRYSGRDLNPGMGRPVKKWEGLKPGNGQQMEN